MQHEEFDSDIFSQSFQRAYRVAEEYDVVGGVEAVTMIVCSKEVVVNGLLSMGVAYPVNRERFDEFGISDKEIGKGCTNAWYIGHVNEHRTGTFMLSLREQ